MRQAKARPPLREVPLQDVFPMRQGLAYATTSIGQWDGILAGAYSAGYVLLELDDDERPVRAYQRQDPTAN